MKPIPIPNHVSDPLVLIMWTAEELILVTAFGCAGIIIDHLWIMLFAGFLLAKLFRKYRDRKPHGFLLHKLYGWGLPLRSKNFVNSYQKRYYS